MCVCVCVRERERGERERERERDLGVLVDGGIKIEEEIKAEEWKLQIGNSKSQTSEFVREVGRVRTEEPWLRLGFRN